MFLGWARYRWRPCIYGWGKGDLLCLELEGELFGRRTRMMPMGTLHSSSVGEVVL